MIMFNFQFDRNYPDMKVTLFALWAKKTACNISFPITSTRFLHAVERLVDDNIQILQ